MISIAWASGIITVPQSFLTPLGGSTYELDLDVFRLALKDLEDDDEGMPWPKTHNHNTEVTLAGITFARQIEIIPPYRVQFEDGIYGVNLVGANSNIPDVLVRNSVSVNTANSAGLIVKPGSIDAASISAIVEAVLAGAVDGSITLVQSMRIMNAILSGKVSGAGSGTETFRNPADNKDRVVVTVDAQGNRTAVVRDLT